MMDFAADVTNTFDRKGSIYPFMRAGLAGYNFGHRRSDDLPNGVCELISKDCNGGWSQLKVINNYDGGTLSRRNSALGSKGIERFAKPPYQTIIYMFPRNPQFPISFSKSKQFS